MPTRAQRSRGVPRRQQLIEQPRSRTPLFIIGGIVFALLLVAALAAVALTSTSTPATPQPANSISVTGEALPLFSAEADQAVGMELPTLGGTSLDGTPMSISPGEGPLVVVVLAHWCHFCQAEVPVLVDYLTEHGAPEGVKVVALTTAIDPARPNYSPARWLERENWTAPTLVDDANDSGLAALGVDSFPGFVFVDAHGIITQRMTGQIGAESFDAALHALAP